MEPDLGSWQSPDISRSHLYRGTIAWTPPTAIYRAYTVLQSCPKPSGYGRILTRLRSSTTLVSCSHLWTMGYLFFLHFNKIMLWLNCTRTQFTVINSLFENGLTLDHLCSSIKIAYIFKKIWYWLRMLNIIWFFFQEEDEEVDEPDSSDILEDRNKVAPSPLSPLTPLEPETPKLPTAAKPWQQTGKVFTQDACCSLGLFSISQQGLSQWEKMLYICQQGQSQWEKTLHMYRLLSLAKVLLRHR